MPGIVKLDRKELIQLIENIEAGGGDASELRCELGAFTPLVKPTAVVPGRDLRIERKEESTEERLTRKIGYLFPEGIPFEQIVTYDQHFGLEQLRERCMEVGVGIGGDKKELAAKLIAQEKGPATPRGAEGNYWEVDMTEEFTDLTKQNEWEANQGEELHIPSVYIENLHYEIIVFTKKERGGSDFTFRCKEYNRAADGQWRFRGVVIDSSKRDPKGELKLVRLSYHPEIVLVDAPFMVVAAPEGEF